MHVDEFLDLLGTACIFFMVEDSFGYLLIEFNDQDKGKTTCTLPYKLYGLLRISLGLKNELSTFQHVTDNILSTVSGQLALLDLHDVIIFRRFVEEPLDYFQTEFDYCKEPSYH